MLGHTTTCDFATSVRARYTGLNASLPLARCGDEMQLLTTTNDNQRNIICGGKAWKGTVVSFLRVILTAYSEEVYQR
jgi:hypothetical protein